MQRQCPAVPKAPPGASVNGNMAAGLLSRNNQFLFAGTVWPGSIWDYKRLDPQYEDFGNFNYGAVGRAFGFSDQILLRAAGFAQEFLGEKYDPSFGHFWQGFPYGDDPDDQTQIMLGITHYNNGCFL